MSARLNRACEMLLQAAIEATKPSGRTIRYFDKEGVWETSVRQGFAGFDYREDVRDKPESHVYKDFIKTLNQKYSTTRTVQKDRVREIIICLMNGATDFAGRVDSLNLLSCEESETAIPVAVAKQCLKDIRDIPLTYPAITTRSISPSSFTTKFLHFLFPNSFVIYDSQAATSIAMWRNFAYECEDDTVAAVTSRFSLKELLENADWYKSFIEFYRILWSSVPEHLRIEANRVAEELQEHLRTRHDKKHVQFTAIDLIDKLLWKANGNPIVLGLAEPPSAS